MKKYPVVNFKSPIIYISFLLMLGISALLMLVILKSESFWLNKFAIIPILIALVFPVYTLTGKVIIDDTLITRKTIFGTRSIKIEDINSFGVMKQEGELGIRIIGESESDTTDWGFPKTIFISKEKDYNPLAYKQKGTIKLHYQKDLYIDILQKIVNCKHSRYS